jgi:Zn finger protein HypA/HybF involved in hydrogenase expression
VRNPAVNTAPVPVSALKPHSSEQVQVCCELYCGTVFSNDRTDYLKELEAGREIYCQACNDACKNETATQTCQTCKHSFTYKAYWYRMKGQEAPKECTPCKNKAKK